LRFIALMHNQYSEYRHPTSQNPGEQNKRIPNSPRPRRSPGSMPGSKASLDVGCILVVVQDVLNPTTEHRDAAEA
jgi:hypothetical protein